MIIVFEALGVVISCFVMLALALFATLVAIASFMEVMDYFESNPSKERWMR